jgi:hypothetical protein
MPRSSSSHPSRTLELLDRVEQGDREAAYDLVRLFRPQDLTEFVTFVWTDETMGPPAWLFDSLADAHAAWLESP